jgi:protein TonB
MLESEDTAPKKQSRPPYLFLIPVGLAVVGFVGYQTVRAGFDTQVHASKFVLDTNQDKTPYTVALHPNDGSRVVITKAAASPTPAPSSTPSATPTPHASASAKAAKTAPHAAAPQPALAHAEPAQSVKHTKSSLPVRLAMNPSQPGTSGSTNDTPLSQPAAETAAPAADTPPPAKATDPPAPAGPIDASDRVVEARMSYAAQPDYPAIQREEGIHGTTVVLVTVDPSGNIVRTSIGSSSGNTALDSSARSAARSSRYLPPRVDGRPATETYRVVYDFAQ